MTSVQFSNATHVFYNPETNCMVSIQYKPELNLFEILRSDVTYVQYMSMNRIIEKRENETWDFLGIL